MSKKLLSTKTAQVVDHAATGAAMKARRISAGRTQQYVADKLGVSVSFVSFLESGSKPWSEERASAFLDALK